MFSVVFAIVCTSSGHPPASLQPGGWITRYTIPSPGRTDWSHFQFPSPPYPISVLFLITNRKEPLFLSQKYSTIIFLTKEILSDVWIFQTLLIDGSEEKYQV